MKTQILALAVLAVIGLTSCNKDDDKVTEPKVKTQKEILTEERWQGKSTISEYYYNGSLVDKEVENITDLSIKFEEDWKLINYENGVATDTMSYTLLANNQIKLDGSNLEDGIVLVCDISTLNDKELKMISTLEEPEDSIMVKLIFEFNK